MEAIEANNITAETLTGVTSSTQPPGPPLLPSKPTPEEIFGSDLGSENGTNGGGGGGGEVVVTTVVETTEVTVVKVVQETKDDTFMFQEEGETFHHSVTVTEKTENNNNEGINVIYNNEAKEKEKEGVFDHLFHVDEDMNEKEKAAVFGDLFDSGGDGINVNNNSEAKVNEKEAVSDHLFNDDEGMNVDYNNEGINVNFTEEEKSVATGDPMDVCSPDQKEENRENIAGLFEFSEDMNETENNEGNVDGGINVNFNNEAEEKDQEMVFEGKTVNPTEEKPENFAGVFEFTEEDMNDENPNLENGEENQEIDEEHDYVAGDFVWGKIKSHPWWPGQIYDPSNASEYANSIKRKGHLLVAYFGDGSFSWSPPSQLKPFIENFQEMSNQSDSKKFVHAVRTALDAVGNLVGAELTCKCQKVDRVDHADVANSGIKPGVAVPKGNTVRVLIDSMSPSELLLKLDTYATFEPGFELELGLDLTVVKSLLGAFYFQKGGYLLPEYHEPKIIEGLEDQSRVGIIDSNVNGPSECGENENGNGDGKSHQKRKQKSVAEIMSVEEKKKAKPVKDGGSGRKRKAALVVSVVESPESGHDSGGGGGGPEDDTMCSPRQRRKSKYLSPPYLSPVWNAKLSGSGSGSFKEPKPEPEKENEKEKEKVNEIAEPSPRRKPRQKKRERDSPDLKEDGKIVINANVDVDGVLSGLLVAALDPTSGSVERKKLSAVTRFVSSFRSSKFETGSEVRPDPEEEEETDVGFVKRKVEEMREMVSGFGEGDEMSEEVKGKLECVIMEVLERVK